jgi:hypothetical protein
MKPVAQKIEAVRVPALRELARGQPCMVAKVTGALLSMGIVSSYFHDPQTVVWCHSNLSHHGKGAHRKADDPFGFLGCAGCHFAIDQGSRLNRGERRRIQEAAMYLTRMHLIENLLIDGARISEADLALDESWLEGWRSGRIKVC